MERISSDLDKDDDEGYIDNNKAYTKLKIGWKASSLYNRLYLLANYQLSFLKFSFVSLIITELQFLYYVYNSWSMPKIPNAISFIFKIIVLKLNNPIYEISSLIILFLCIIFLVICIFFDFLKPKDSLAEFPRQLELTAAFIASCIYSILAFPVLFSLFNFLECANNADDESKYYLQCYSFSHILITIISIVCFFIIFSFSNIQYSYVINIKPTFNYKLSLNKYTGKEDFYVFIGKILIVMNEYLIEEYFKKKIIAIIVVALIAIFITWRQLNIQPFYCNKCNYYRNIMYTGFSFAVIMLLILTVLKLNDKSYSIFLVIGVQLVGSIIGYFVGNAIKQSKVIRVYKNLKEKYTNYYTRREAFTSNNEDDDLQSNYSLDRIVNDFFIAKKDHIFNSINDCVFACYFIKHNHNLDSFSLASKILDECTIQYKKSPMSYIYYWLFLNTMIMVMKTNLELYNYETCIKEIELFERIQNNILKKVIRLENSIYSKYLIYYILIVRSDNSKDDLSENERERDQNLNFHEHELKKHSLNLHIKTLEEIHNTFKDLKSINVRDDVYRSVNNIVKLTKCINETEISYKAYIKACFMSSDSLLLYNLFLENIMIDYYTSSFYMKLIEENKEKKKKKSLNRSSLMRQSRSKSISESQENLEYTKRVKNYATVKKEKKKQNENKERVLERLQKPVQKFSFLMRLLIIIEYLIMAIGYYYYKYTYNSLRDSLNYIDISARGPRLMNRATLDIRLLSVSSLAQNEEVFNNTFNSLLEIKEYLDDKYIPLVSSVNTLYISDANIYKPLGNNYDLFRDISHENYFQVTLDIQKNLNVILNREYLSNQSDLLNNQYFRYFSENSKGSHEIIYLDSLKFIQDLIVKDIDHQLLVVLLIIIISHCFVLLISIREFLPSMKKINKFKFCMVQLFRDVPEECIDRIIRFHDKQAQNYFTKHGNIIKNTSEDEEKMKYKKTYVKNKSKLDLYYFVFMVIVSGFFMILPLLSVFIFRYHSLGEVELIFVSTKRTYYAQAIQTWVYELFYMDSNSYRMGEPSAFILEALDILEDLEKSINKGTYGGRPINKYEILNPLTQNKGCIRGSTKEYECEERVYDEDFNEQIANSPLNVIMSEYILQTRDFIESFENNYKALRHTRNDAKERLDKILSDKYIIFLNKIIKEINGHVDKMNEILVNDIFSFIDTSLALMDVLHIISMIFIPLIYCFYFKKYAKEKLREMETLTIIFSNVPRSVCEKSTKIKLFIRHGTLESAF